MNKIKIIVVLSVILVVIFFGAWKIFFRADVMNSENKEAQVVLESPIANAVIKSPLSIIGKARGGWFFEASFPIILTDETGQIISTQIAQARGEWMTSDFVPFEATFSFEKPSKTKKGFLIFKKDNPSGLPENDVMVSVPVLFE